MTIDPRMRQHGANLINNAGEVLIAQAEATRQSYSQHAQEAKQWSPQTAAAMDRIVKDDALLEEAEQALGYAARWVGDASEHGSVKAKAAQFERRASRESDAPTSSEEEQQRGGPVVPVVSSVYPGALDTSPSFESSYVDVSAGEHRKSTHAALLAAVQGTVLADLDFAMATARPFYYEFYRDGGGASPKPPSPPRGEATAAAAAATTRQRPPRVRCAIVTFRAWSRRRRRSRRLQKVVAVAERQSAAVVRVHCMACFESARDGAQSTGSRRGRTCARARREMAASSSSGARRSPRPTTMTTLLSRSQGGFKRRRTLQWRHHSWNRSRRRHLARNNNGRGGAAPLLTSAAHKSVQHLGKGTAKRD